MKFKLFNKKIEPSCSYCAYGRINIEGDKVFCTKCGIVESYGYCRKFSYDPLKREPKKAKLSGEYSQKDFEL